MLVGSSSLANMGLGISYPVVAVADDNPSTVVGYTSNKGVTFSSPSIHSDRWGDVAWNGSIFCAVSRTNNDTATSSDGLTWTYHSAAMTGASGALAVVYGNGKFVAFENSAAKAYYSTDGITWTQVSLPGGLSSNNAYCYNGTVFLTIATSSSNAAATSPDGVTFTARTMPSSANWGDVAWNGSVFCAVIQNSKDTATSPDGITWTLHSTALPWAGAGAICSDGTQFVATEISSLGTGVATSPDGITWTSRTSAFTFTPDSKCLVWDGAEFMGIVKSVNGNGATSPDGIVWTAITAPNNIFAGACAQYLQYGTF